MGHGKCIDWGIESLDREKKTTTDNNRRLRAALTAALLVLVMLFSASAAGLAFTGETGTDAEVSSETETAQAGDSADAAAESDTAAEGETAEDAGTPAENGPADQTAEPETAAELISLEGKEINTMVSYGDPKAEPPSIKAQGAAMYSRDVGQYVYKKNEKLKLSPYSITKILTCYLALEKLDLDETVTVSEKATRVYENGTTIWLKTGEEMTVRDLIYGTLLESGNDAAYALGEEIAGSEKAFAKLMNRTVKDWGCKNTHFVNANGWKHRNHYTTAQDMMTIALKCFSNETLAEMSNTETYTVPATNMSPAREFKNYMRHIAGESEYIIAGKTGSWDEDDCSIVVEFNNEGVDGVIVLLGDTKKKRGSDVKKLIEFAPKVTPGFLVADEGNIVANTRVRHGEETKVDLQVAGRTVAYPAGVSVKGVRVEMLVNKLEAPLKAGDVAGKYFVYCDGKKIGEHDLVVSKDIATGWLPSYLYISNKQTIVIGEILLGLLVIILILVLIRKGRKKRPPEYEGKH